MQLQRPAQGLFAFGCFLKASMGHLQLEEENGGGITPVAGCLNPSRPSLALQLQRSA